MDFHLTNEQQMLRKMYREFAENEVKPLAEEIDEEERFPMETVEKMAKLGMMGIYFPTSVGGAGGDVLSYVMAVEELSKVCGTTGVIVSAHTSLPIFSTVSLGKYSSASTFLARGLTSFSANSRYIFCTICCCLDRVKSIAISS